MSTAPPPEQHWSPWAAPLALLLGITLSLLVGSVVLGISAAVAGTSDTPGASLVSTALQDACFVCGALVIARSTGRISVEQFGLRPVRLRTALAWGVGAYVAFAIFSDFWLRLVNESSKDDKTLSDLGVDHSTLALIATALVVCVLAPIAEEFLFRGFIFTALRNWAGPWGAAIVTGLLFGAVHLDPNRPIGFLLPLAFLGFLLCIVYWKTGSLYPCIALHAINNSIAFGVTEDWSWQIPVLVVAALAAVAGILLPAVRWASGRRSVA